MLAIIPARKLSSEDSLGDPPPRPRFRDHFELQTIRRAPQAKTRRRFPISLGFKQLARGLHARFFDVASCQTPPASLAATAIVRISSGARVLC
jgi:hypothetical protein